MEKKIYSLLKQAAKGFSHQKINPIQELLQGEDLIELMINRHDDVYGEALSGTFRLGKIFLSPEEYKTWFYDFLSQHQQVLNYSKPICDFEIKGLFRVNAVSDIISGHEPVLTIRRLNRAPFEEEALLSSFFFTPDQVSYLKQALQEKKTIFISGGTSSGKTTLLNFLMDQLPLEDRIIIIEDTQEIVAKANRNVVYLRAKEGEYQAKQVTISDLVKTALRMRPDRLILGEIRRDEIVDFLHAINTGHPGSLCTGHGNSPVDMMNRLEMLMIKAGLPSEACKGYLGRGIDIIVQMKKDPHRHIKEIVTLEGHGQKLRFRQECL